MQYFLPSAVCLVLILFFGEPARSADPAESFLDESVDIGDLLSDIPPGFHLPTASVDEITNLPAFTRESAESVRRAFDRPGSLREPGETIGALDGLSALQKTILLELTAASKGGYDSRTTFTLRAGHRFSPRETTPEAGGYRFRIGVSRGDRFNAVIIGERDEDEPRALDLASGGISIASADKRYRAVIGDYRASFGEGLVASRYGRSYAAGTDVATSPTERRLNTFFEETAYLRGALISADMGRARGEIMFSSRDLDATLDDDGNAVTIRRSGIHDSPNNRGILGERVLAARLHSHFGTGLRLGATAMRSAYDPPLTAAGGEASMHDAAGGRFTHLALDGSVRSGDDELFFEHARMNGGEHASLAGIESRRGRVRTGLAARYYSKGYRAFRSGALSSFGSVENEKGVYAAVDVRFSRSMRLDCALDLAKSLFRRYYGIMPESRRRFKMLFRQDLGRGFDLGIGGRAVDDAGDDNKRWNMLVKIKKSVSDLPFDAVSLHGAWSGDKGVNGPFMELITERTDGVLRFRFQASIFDIPAYGARYYRYDYSVPGRGMAGALWGRGASVGFVGRWRFASLEIDVTDSDRMSPKSEITFQIDTVF